MNKLPENTIELPCDAEIEARTRATFRAACEHTDSYHALRLGMARRKAVHVGKARAASRVWAPLAGAVACGALAIGISWMNPAPQTGPAATAVPLAPAATGSGRAEDVTPEIGSTQMEMVKDLDFYRWLAAQPAVAPARHRSAR